MDRRSLVVPRAVRKIAAISILLLLVAAFLSIASPSSLAQTREAVGSQGGGPGDSVSTSAGHGGVTDSGGPMPLDQKGWPSDPSIPPGQSVDPLQRDYRGTYPSSPSAADDQWDSRFGTRGPNGIVSAMAMIGSDLYIGGSFTVVDGVSANDVARWDGSRWHSLSGGIHGTVAAMAVRGTDLYVSGRFTYAANGSDLVQVNGIAEWDGSKWSAVGNVSRKGMDDFGYGYALAFDSNGALYLGGSFQAVGGVPAHDIAMWDGSKWSEVGGGVTSGQFANVLAIVTSGTNVYIGGYFSSLGSVPANSVALWNGSQWSALGSGLSDLGQPAVVHALAFYGGSLYAGGLIDTAGGVRVAAIARWSGSQWSAVGSSASGGSGGTVYALLVRPDGLYAGGNFASMGGVSAQRTARWDGSRWSALGTDFVGVVRALGGDEANLYAGGDIHRAGGILARNLARWNGSEWGAMGVGTNNGTNDEVLSLLTMGSDVYAGGRFAWAGSLFTRGTAKWNGSGWSNLGAGVGEAVFAWAQSGNDVYAAGFIYDVPGADETTRNLVKWDGTNWQDVGGGVGNQDNQGARANALAVSGSNLYVGGAFNQAGSNDLGNAIPVSNLARWDGSHWHDVGGGTNGVVNALVIIGGDLYAGGSFTSAGGVSVNNIARWDGTQWHAVGTGVTYSHSTDGAVYALAMDGTNLYAGGLFDVAGGTPVHNLAKWDGSQWSDVGGGTDDEVRALATSDSSLYVGGRFSAVGGNVQANGIAVWNGDQWSALGSGVDGVVEAISLSANGDVNIGGSFGMAGGKASNNFAIWHTVPWPIIDFTDAPIGSPFYPYVYRLAMFNAVSGYGCGGPHEPCDDSNNPYFRTGNPVTRGQLSKIVANSVGFIDPVPAGRQTYADIAPGSTFWLYIERLALHNVMSGYQCGGAGEPCDSQHRPYFRPNANVSRGQTSKIVANAAGFQDAVPASQQTYTDVPPSGPGSTFWVYIERLSTRGVMSGYGCGGPGEPCDTQHSPYFRPGADVTRGQSAKIVANTFFPGSQP